MPEEINRIIGLRAGALRLLVYMDAAGLIAGVEEIERDATKPYLMAYPELTCLPSVGPLMGGDPELILNVNPDVIFISYTTKGDADALQKKTGIPVIAIECPEFATGKDRLFDSFKLIGRVLQKENRADSLISYIKRSIGMLHNLSDDIPENQRPTVYIGGVNYSGSFGINSTQPFYPPYIFTNSRNVASGINERLISHVKGTFVDKEQLLLWNPDYIFIDQSGYTNVRQDMGKNSVLYNGLDAVQGNKIFALYPYNNYAINYEMVLANAWYVGKVLYPERFQDVIIESKTDEILEAFLGKIAGMELISKHFRQIDKNELQ